MLAGGSVRLFLEYLVWDPRGDWTRTNDDLEKSSSENLPANNEMFKEKHCQYAENKHNQPKAKGE